MIAELVILLGLLFLEPVLAIHHYAVRKALPRTVTVAITIWASFLYGLTIALVTWLISGIFVQTSFQDFLVGGIILGGAFSIICAYVFLIKAIRNRAHREGSGS